MTNSGDQVKGDEERVRAAHPNVHIIYGVHPYAGINAHFGGTMHFLGLTWSEAAQHPSVVAFEARSKGEPHKHVYDSDVLPMQYGENLPPDVQRYNSLFCACGHVNRYGTWLPASPSAVGEPRAMKQAGTIFGVEPYGEGDALVGACNLLDTIKQEWGDAWSEHDQKVRAGLSAMLIERHRVASLPPEAPQPDGIGWCSSCDKTTELCRPKCPHCGDWLVFAADDKPEAPEGAKVKVQWKVERDSPALPPWQIVTDGTRDDESVVRAQFDARIDCNRKLVKITTTEEVISVREAGK